MIRRERLGDSQCDPDGADEGDGSPEQAADETHHLTDPVHRVQQLRASAAAIRRSQDQGGGQGGGRTLSQEASGSRYLASLEESAWAPTPPFCCCVCARDCFADDLALAISLSLWKAAAGSPRRGGRMDGIAAAHVHGGISSRWAAAAPFLSLASFLYARGAP
nr:unnamed protein product [Digitaria exilis]